MIWNHDSASRAILLHEYHTCIVFVSHASSSTDARLVHCYIQTRKLQSCSLSPILSSIVGMTVSTTYWSSPGALSDKAQAEGHVAYRYLHRVFVDRKGAQ